MLLEIRDLKQNSFKITVKLSDTILQVKEKIKLKTLYDVDDQKLIFSGNSLPNDRTVAECEFDMTDYLTVVFNPLKNNEVQQMMEDTNIDDTESGGQDSGKDLVFKNGTEITHSGDSSDSESYEISRNALLELIPNMKNFCDIMSNNPVELPKMLSKFSGHGRFVIEAILENQHAFIELLNTEEHNNKTNVVKQLDTKDYVAIDRLIEKGFEKEFVMQVYQACDLNEISASEFLLALKE